MNKQSLTLITSNQILALGARAAAAAVSATKASSGMSIHGVLLILFVVGSLSTGFGGGPATGPRLPLALPISTQCYERDLKNPPEGISAARKK